MRWPQLTALLFWIAFSGFILVLKPKLESYEGFYSALLIFFYLAPRVSILRIRWVHGPRSLIFAWIVGGWTSDGLQFRRTSANLTVRLHGFDGAIPIQKLRVYPMRYAPQDLCSHLKSRGQRFWNLIRFQNYVSYTGWDVMKDENHVRYSFDTSS